MLSKVPDHGEEQPAYILLVLAGITLSSIRLHAHADHGLSLPR